MIGKNFVRRIAVLAALTLPGLMSQARETPSCLGSEIQYSVSIPQRDDDVVYKVRVAESAAPGDTLLGKSYYIEWEYQSDGTRGFSCYFDGNLYTYNGDDRLREYHAGWDLTPFRPRQLGNRPVKGVHENVRFFALLPTEIKASLRQLHTDSTWTVDRRGNRLEAVMRLPDGEEAMRKTISYRTDSTMAMLTEYNIGQVSEQAEMATIIPDNGNCPPASEEELAALWPEVFDKFRESNFRIESIIEQPLPTLSLPTTTGERYLHHKGDSFRQPTLVALIDPTQVVAPEMVKALRSAAETSPRPIDLIMAFTGTDIDGIERLTGSARMDEHLLMNAQAAARKLGAANLPVVLICSPDGIIENIVIGVNPNLSSIVFNTISKQY